MITKIKHIQIILVFSLVFSLNIFPQSKADKIDQVLGKYVEYKEFNGAALVAENGKVIFKKGYGYANFEWDIPNTPDTKYLYAHNAACPGR